MGIDEAGRGPVIGPLVFCGYVLHDSDVKKLKKLGVRDSKELKIEKMKEMVKELEKVARSIIYIEIEPQIIDHKNLSLLTIEKFAELINSSDAERVFFDAPVPSRFVKRYESKLRKLITREVELVGEVKADKKFPCVSAASICAKVRREERITELKEIFGDFGSGYPGDDKTLNFLKQYCLQGKFPEIVRRKWQTLKRIEFLIRQNSFAF